MGFSSTETPASRSRRLSLRKKLLFSFLISLIAVAGLEVFARFYVSYAGSYAKGLTMLRAEQRSLAMGARGSDAAREQLHPYVGWTYDAHSDPGVKTDSEVIPVNGFGLVDHGHPLHKKSPDKLIIGVTGGSFAMDFNNFGAERFVTELTEPGVTQGREVVVVRLALAAYKQPQQLLLLTYLYSIGAEFDYIMNIDGFNEAVLPITNNYPSGVHYSYPNRWDLRLYDVVDPRLTGTTFELLKYRARRQQLAQGIEASPFRRSALRNLIWKIQDDYLLQRMTNYSLEVSNFESGRGKAFARTGPENAPLEDGALKSNCLDLWRVASFQMSRICEANGTRYLHVLQPNQYVEDSKTFTPYELEHALAVGHEFQVTVGELYPQMMEQKEWFRERGVSFHDLTQVFATTDATVYRDWCCHINVEGNEILAKELAAIVAGDLQVTAGSTAQ